MNKPRSEIIKITFLFFAAQLFLKVGFDQNEKISASLLATFSKYNKEIGNNVYCNDLIL